MVIQTSTGVREASPLQLKEPHLVRDLRALEGVVQRFCAAPSSTPMMFDVETTNLDPRTSKLVMLIFQLGEDRPVVLDMRKVSDAARPYVSRTIRPLFDRFLIVGHNLSFDYAFMKVHLGVQMKRVWDCMIAEQVLYGVGLSDARNQKIGLSLKACAERRGIEMSKEERNWFIDLDQRDGWYQPFPTEQLMYASMDVHAPSVIYPDQLQVLREKGERYEADCVGCAELEMLVLPPKSDVECHGVFIDQAGWREVLKEQEAIAHGLEEQLHHKLDPAILEARAERFDLADEKSKAWEAVRDAELQEARSHWETVYKACGKEKTHPWGEYKTHRMKEWRGQNPNPGKPKPDTSIPNMNSTTQLLDAFGKLGIPAKNTSSEVLKELKDEHPVIDLLLQWRKAKKFGESFGENLLSKIDPETGLLYPHINQIGASSNRMSADNPNTQQIPSKGAGSRLRHCIIAPPGQKLLTADFSSQELLILAELSGDATMLRLLDEGADLHSETARMMFGLSQDVNPKKFEIAPGIDARTATKTINYGIAYGMTKYRLARMLGITTQRAQELIEAWYNTYPQVRAFLLSSARTAVDYRFSSTRHGWVRHYPSLPLEPVRPFKLSQDQYRAWKNAHREWEKVVRAVENKGMNTPIQGLGAGITKRALVNFSCAPKLDNESVVLIVHDELVVQCSEESAERVAEKLADAMDDAMRFYLHKVRVPRSQVNIGDFWAH